MDEATKHNHHDLAVKLTELLHKTKRVFDEKIELNTNMNQQHTNSIEDEEFQFNLDDLTPFLDDEVNLHHNHHNHQQQQQQMTNNSSQISENNTDLLTLISDEALKNNIDINIENTNSNNQNNSLNDDYQNLFSTFSSFDTSQIYDLTRNSSLMMVEEPASQIIQCQV